MKKRLQLKKRGIIFSFLPISIICLIFLLTGCETSEDQESAFDENLINQHMDAEVTLDEKYRPQYHYTPKMNWMNDPNGLVYYEGQYHLYHQYNPFGNTWGYMSWGHAVSDDLVNWEHRPVAIPYGEEEQEGIFSGSAVVDHNNTSGFGDGSTTPIVAIYTSAYGGDEPDQAQSLAYSLDGGETFTKYEGNPVLNHEDPDFRDPNVKWMDELDQWMMVVALPKQHIVQFYVSDNLIDWELLSEFGPAGGVDGIWECPDFFQLPVDGNPDNMKWVLQVDMNPGSIAGGSGSQYFIGDWNGTEFIPDDENSNGEIFWTDYGTDFYAAITWNNVPEDDGRRMWVGWMNNWDYANEIPTDPWRSAMSIPRSLHLEEVNDQILMVQRPVEELQQLRQDRIQLQNISVEDGEISSLSDQGLSGKAYEMIVDIDPGESDAAGIMVRVGDGEETIVGYDARSETAFVDRRDSGQEDFTDEFGIRNDAPALLVDGKVRLHIFVDWSSVELFVNNGIPVITNRIFPDPESQDIQVFAQGGMVTIEKIEFWPLSSIWDQN